MQVRIRAASRERKLPMRAATVRALIYRPGYRQNCALIEYADTGAQAEVPLARIAPTA